MVYLIYVDDPPQCIKYSHTLTSADDIKDTFPIASFQDIINLQNYIYQISHWCTQWKLFFFFFKKFIHQIFSLGTTPVFTSLN